MCSPISSCLELLQESQIDEVRPSNTPGPLSIAFFFLGFILINQSIRRLFPSNVEDRSNNHVLSQEPKVDGRDAKEEEEEEEEDGSASKDLMRMILLRNKSLSSQPPRITHNRFSPSKSTARSILSHSPSISSPIRTLTTPGVPSTWVDSHRHIVQPIHTDSLSQDSQHLAEVSDSCSESTTSA